MNRLEEMLDLEYPGAYAEQALEILREKSNIILFGAAEYGGVIGNYLMEHQIKVSCYCDNNTSKIGSVWNGLSVIDPKEITLDSCVVITCNAYREVTRQVKGLGCDDVFYFNVNWIRYPKGKRQFILEHLPEFQKIYDELADERSRKTFVNLLNYKITYKQEYTEEIIGETQYFDEEIYALPQNYTFVDAGSYIGDTVQSLLMQPGVPKKIICMDPIPQNIERLQNYLQKEKLDFVDVYECGVSDTRREECFDTENSMAARKSNSDGNVVLCDSIDHICLEKYDRIDVIKMDIEGSEELALRGARAVIERDHPILAICVYHKEDDFIVLPQLIKELYDGYKLYFRHYELSDEETVCFAVP